LLVAPASLWECNVESGNTDDVMMMSSYVSAHLVMFHVLSMSCLLHTLVFRRLDLLHHVCIHCWWQAEMEMNWVRYDVEKNVTTIAVADALLEDLLHDLMANLVD